MNRRSALALLASPALAGLLSNHAIASPQSAVGWPRRVTNADGSETEIAAPPQRILSTSVTLTGSLLAIGAPVVASATSARGVFFDQWAAVAARRGVEPLWPAGSVDPESVWAVAPDLIVVSASGADSALPQIDTLRAVAPVLLLDYGAHSWITLSQALAYATGRETETMALLDGVSRQLDDLRSRLTLPPGQANIISYNGPGAPNPIGTRNGTHGQLLAALGFDIEDPSPDWQSDGTPTADFIRAAYENLTLLRAETTFLVSVDDDRAMDFLADPLLANLPSVRSGRVFALGPNSFRIDYYSAQEIVDTIARRFGRT